MEFELEKRDEGWARAFRDACHVEAKRPPHFWAAQRAHIRERVVGREKRPFWLVIATTAALFVLAALLLQRSPAPTVNVAHHSNAISDQQLLADIDETLSNPMPEALAPADLIAQDIDRSLKASGKKETR